MYKRSSRLSRKWIMTLNVTVGVLLTVGLGWLAATEYRVKQVLDTRGVEARAVIQAKLYSGSGWRGLSDEWVEVRYADLSTVQRAKIEVTPSFYRAVKEGESIRVIYNPDDPSQARVATAWGVPPMQWVRILGMAVAAWGIVGVVMLVRRRRGVRV
jgi:hypothetical protein